MAGRKARSNQTTPVSARQVQATMAKIERTIGELGALDVFKDDDGGHYIRMESGSPIPASLFEVALYKRLQEALDQNQALCERLLELEARLGEGGGCGR